MSPRLAHHCHSVLSTSGNKDSTRGLQRVSNKLSELQKLCIVSQLRGKGSSFSGSSSIGQLHLLHRDFIFAPTHSLHSELCMILQTRYFLLLDETSITAASDKHDMYCEGDLIRRVHLT